MCINTQCIAYSVQYWYILVKLHGRDNYCVQSLSPRAHYDYRDWNQGSKGPLYVAGTSQCKLILFLVAPMLGESHECKPMNIVEFLL